MTAIAGIARNGRVHLAGDSAVMSGWDTSLNPAGKIWRTGPYVIGSSGSSRAATLLRYALTPPAPEPDLPMFMATTFVDAIRQTLKAGGYATRESEREDGGAIMLVGICGRMFTVWTDYCTQEAAQPYAAIGCGNNLAIGALYATENTGLSPRRRLTLALEAAERFSGAVRSPFTFASTRRTP